MARLARIVVPGVPHHVTQRGARRMQVFFTPDDYCAYRRILAGRAQEHGLSILAYCLMPNHVHLIAVPSTAQGLARPFGEAHHDYAIRINRRNGWTGHLWQERFFSFAMDEPFVAGAIRYVLLNPVRAGLAPTPVSWPYSSARAHLEGGGDELVDSRSTAQLIDDWDYLSSFERGGEPSRLLRRHSRVGRPLGSESFLDELERATGRRVRREAAGRKKI